jgi:hypothetical protein
LSQSVPALVYVVKVPLPWFRAWITPLPGCWGDPEQVIAIIDLDQRESSLAPRDPSRAKASHISDAQMRAVVDAFVLGGVFPTDALPEYPSKVKIAKLRKLESKGLIVKAPRYRWAVTPAGRAILDGEAA